MLTFGPFRMGSILQYMLNKMGIRGIFSCAFLTTGLLISVQTYAQPEGYVKSHLSVVDGLSQNEVTTICEDKYGFLWFGTRGGLNRYDGYIFRHFKPTGKISEGLQNPSIERLSNSDDGKMWIGTKSGGFTLYDPVLESFTNGSEYIRSSQDRVIAFLHDMQGGNWLGSFSNGLVHQPPGDGSAYQIPLADRVSSIIQTPDSTIWIGTPLGLYRKDPGGDFRHIDLINRNFEITRIIHDQNTNHLWMVGWGLQLLRYDYVNDKVKLFPLPYRSERSVNTYSLIMDRQGYLWVGTWGEGLYRFNPATGEFSQVNLNLDAEYSNVSDFNIVLDIYEDKQGIIWVGTDGGGIVKFSPALQFRTIENFGQDLKVHVNAISKTSQGQYLIGTRGKGLYASGDLKNFKQINPGNASMSLNNQSVYFLNNFRKNAVWAGTEQGAMILRSDDRGKLKLMSASQFFQSPDLATPRKVLSILSRESELWFGTQQQGLYYFKTVENEYKLVKHFTAAGEGGLKNNRISNVMTDASGKLWIGTYNGLYQYNAKDSSFISIDSLLSNASRPLCNIILTLSIDNEDRIWFGTPCSLNKLIDNGNGSYSLTEYTTEDGLPDDYLSNIIPDDFGNIWISTNSGISKLIEEENEFQNFEASDGTGKYTFSEAASYKSDEGLLFFGGFAGITYFDPEVIEINRYVPPVVITDFKVLNSDIQVGASEILPISINEMEKLRLTYREREVSIEFAALDYRSPIKNRYIYKLEKNHEASDWIYIGKRREISLQNLDPGIYTLYLGGSNSNGLLNREGRILEIEVIPAPWESWYAFLIYILVILGIVVSIVYVSLKQERLKTQAHLEHMNLEREKQLNEYKLRFFTNISHEFRTPLSLILAPINDLIRMDMSKLNSDVSKKINIIYKNANSLLKLVNQLLEFRRIEVGKAQLEASRQDFITFSQDILEPFEELADHKNVSLKKSFKASDTEIYFDQQKMSVVLNNLLSNAFKYCGEPCIIEFKVAENEQEIIASVANNGKSIPEKEQQHIFDRFYHISSENYQGSSGIGLALVKSYLEMHHGSIEIDSIKGGMTTFTIRLLKGKEHLAPEMILEESPGLLEQPSFALFSSDTPAVSKFHHHGSKNSRILIVEDNIEVIHYLQSVLGDYYEIHSAVNGKEGFDKAVKLLPDLIISDVMMPEMDGFELCKMIRSNEKLAHLPLILLTAKDTPSDILFGVKKGADAYITKPFDTEILMEKVKQLLLSRSALARKYSKKILLEPTDKEITSADEKFINSALKYVENNISNTELNLEDMARELAMSSTTMYRRMKAVINQSPGEFIRTVKFKRASQLLRDTMLTVSEIIEMVGYQDAKRFRENFRKEFGLTPGEYREQFKNDPGSPQSHQGPEVR